MGGMWPPGPGPIMPPIGPFGGILCAGPAGGAALGADEDPDDLGVPESRNRINASSAVRCTRLSRDETSNLQVIAFATDLF